MSCHVISCTPGKWDGESKMLYVQASFPCTSTERREDDGSTGKIRNEKISVLCRTCVSHIILNALLPKMKLSMDFIFSSLLYCTYVFNLPANIIS